MIAKTIEAETVARIGSSIVFLPISIDDLWHLTHARDACLARRKIESLSWHRPVTSVLQLLTGLSTAGWQFSDRLHQLRDREEEGHADFPAVAQGRTWP